MVFDPLLDEPERMMRLIVKVPANAGQDLRRDVGEVIAGVGVAQDLHGVLANHRPGGGAVFAKMATHKGVAVRRQTATD